MSNCFSKTHGGAPPLCDIIVKSKHRNLRRDSRRNHNNVKLTKRELEGIDALLDSGSVNMLETESVIYFARKLGYIETANWVVQNRELYIKGIVVGFYDE